MNLPAAIYAARWFARDTFCQAKSSGLHWLMLGVSGLAVLVCLSVSVSGGLQLKGGNEPAEFLPRNDPQLASDKVDKQVVDVLGGELTLMFGAFRVPLGRDAEDAVRQLQMLL